MVWFQCEDCGENLKKPKLANHFRGCSARKLSCIDCGVVYDQVSVHQHTSCVTEAEKYGPKGAANSKNAQKLKNAPIQSSGDLDLKHGLSTRSPWACSLCNVKATSEEALVLHSEGKKHRNKVKATVTKAAGNETANLPAEETKSVAPARDENTQTEQLTILDTPVSVKKKKKRKSDQHENGGEVQLSVSRAPEPENANIATVQRGEDKLRRESKRRVDSAVAVVSGAAEDKAISTKPAQGGEVYGKKQKKIKKTTLEPEGVAGRENGAVKIKESTDSKTAHSTGTDEMLQSNEGVPRKSKTRSVDQAYGQTQNGNSTHAEGKSKVRKSNKRKAQSSNSDDEEVPRLIDHRKGEAV